MNKFKPSSKLRILAIVSCVIIVIGMVIGTVFHFIGNGFFNYSGEYSSYKSVTLSYSEVQVNMVEGGVDFEEICNTAFKKAGVSEYLITEDSSTVKINGVLEYRFKSSTDSANLKSATNEINTKIKEVFADVVGEDESVLACSAVMHDQQTVVGGGHVTEMAAIALATIVVVHLLYTLIRYKLSAALTAIVADLHNIALFAAILALCRVPLSSTAMIFAVLVTLATAIGVTYMLDRIKRNAKEDAKLSVEEVTDLSAGQTFKINIALPATLATAAVLMFAVMAISAMSALPVLVPALIAVVGFAVTVYGTTLFAPAIYCFIKKTSNKISAKPSQKKGN